MFESLFPYLLITVCVLLAFAFTLCAPIIERLPDGYWIIHYTIPFINKRTYKRFKF